MALSWEDVVHKQFQLTKFREGYDRQEVEDFLDQVVEELRRLAQENADLRARAPFPPTPADGPAGAGDVLALARRLHAESVADGERRWAALVAEAGSGPDAPASAPEPHAEQAVAGLEARRAVLEREVARLEERRTELRAELTAWLEGRLRELTEEAGS